MPTRSFSPASAQTLPTPIGLSPNALQGRAADAASLLKALANPQRLLLLCQLVGCERSVTELGVATGVEQPSLSQQLGVLRGERLVATRRDGKNMFYRVDSPAALALLQTLYGLFCNEASPTSGRKRPIPSGVRIARRSQETQ